MPDPLSLKLSLLAEGVRLSPDASAAMTADGRPLSVFEYPTTGGITMEVPGAGYVNAPFDGPFAASARWLLDVESEDGDVPAFVLRDGGACVPVRPLPLPGYIGARDSQGRPVDAVVMSHADRARFSPVQGCAFRCQFCDAYTDDYVFHPLERLLEAAGIALADPVLPVRHVLVSGGTPARPDVPALTAVCAALAEALPLPVDVMYTPREATDGIVSGLADAGVHGLSINLELYGEAAQRRIAPQKAAIGRAVFGHHIEEAASRFPGSGRVRSLLIVGLEPLQETLAGVRWLCERGCQPVLSPFRPSPGTPLANAPPPPLALLRAAWEATAEIADRYGLRPGPDCVPCQHNCIALPEPGRAP
ncbi:radical SAM protein [Roseospira navarrensis]|nr:radical SAM protein [Roseospira navarrensis]